MNELFSRLSYEHPLYVLTSLYFVCLGFEPTHFSNKKVPFETTSLGGTGGTRPTFSRPETSSLKN